MARPKTGDKRGAILEAAAVSIAADGLGASTANIAKRARVAEGSLFRYFADKEELLNELYRELKRSIREAMTSGFPAGAPLKVRAQHIWESYLSWGIHAPHKRKAFAQLTVSDRMTEETVLAGQVGFDEVNATMREVVERGRLSSLPPQFTSSLFLSMAETTMAQIAAAHGQDEHQYRAIGFEAFWNAAAKK